VLIDIELPENDFESRMTWGGERYADLADGTLPISTKAFVVAVVLGWADLGPEWEREQYRSLAKRISQLAPTE
jgi:hypothetical protein